MVFGKGTTLRVETAASNEECDYSEDAIATSVVLQLAGVACAKAANVVGNQKYISL